MQLLTLGINHHTAPLSLRERVAFPLEQFKPALGMLRQHLSHPRNTAEAAILSTCNRTEICYATDDSLPKQTTHEHAIRRLAQHYNTDPGELAPHVYSLGRSLMVHHASRVASGLDSTMPGEIQILGQVRDAVHTITEAGALGMYLSQLPQRALAVAKKVRGTTEIGAHSVSMVAVAVRLAQRIFESTVDQRVLLINAGEMIELYATHFTAQTLHEVVIADRTLEHGKRFAESLSSQDLNAHAVRLAGLPTKLVEFDIVVPRIASALSIIGLGAVERAIKQRRHCPMFMVDLAAPRDVEPEIARLSDMFLYTVDNLGVIVRESDTLRQVAVAQTEAVIETRVLNFVHRLDACSVVPIIRDLHAQAETLCQGELERAQRMLARGDGPTLALRALSQALTKKFLHGPMHALSHAQGEDHEQLIDPLPTLFRQSGHSER